MEADTKRGLYWAPRSDAVQGKGKFRTRFNFPGRNHPDHDDHGYGPLATVVESFMDPNTRVPMHPHRDEEIISWVPEGVMRHDDGEGNRLVTDADHLMIMNAGREFWHEERTLADDPPLRMLQIFVRPHSLDLDPDIQHGPVPDSVPNQWRHLFGPAESDAPFWVRNEAHLYDARLDAGAELALPDRRGFDAYFYVFEGSVEAGGQEFSSAETGLFVGDDSLVVTAGEATTLVLFLVDPDAPVTRQGTIGR